MKKLQSGQKSNFTKGQRVKGQDEVEGGAQEISIHLMMAERRKFYHQQKRARVIAGIIKYKEEQKKIEMEK